MAEGAWLDNLSEDWDSQPRSSSSPILPTVSLPGTQRSRIPRFSGASDKSLVQQAQRRPSSARSALREKNGSDVNIPMRSPAASKTNSTKTHATHKSAASSQGSVVHHSTVARAARQALPRGSAKATPEWKKLAMRNLDNPASQPDVFAPVGLESIFQKPSSEAESSENGQTGFPLFRQTETMPSSPPPWPAGHRGSAVFSATDAEYSTISSLNRVPEDDEYGETSSAWQNDDGQGLTRMGDSSIASPERLQQPAREILQATADQPDKQTDMAKNLRSLDSYTQKSGSASRQPVSMQQFDSSELPDQSQLSKQASSVAISNGFSPVYISKHATLDGQVDYAAVDPSDPKVVEQFPRTSLPGSNPSRSSSHHQQRQASSGSEALQPIGEFVELERGGHSLAGSFRHRPLSPSTTSQVLPSESLVPSDSISHADGHQRSEFAQSEKDRVDLRRSTPTATQSDSRNGDGVTTVSKVASVAQTPEDSDLSLDNPHAAMPGLCRVEPSSLQTKEGSQLSSRIGQTRTKVSIGKSWSQTDHGIGDIPETVHPVENEEALFAATAPQATGVPLSADANGNNNEFSDATGETLTATNDSIIPSKQAVIGFKRKDARYDSSQSTTDPSTIARRQILRPRNPTPGAGIPQVSKPSTLLDMRSGFSSEALSHRHEYESDLTTAEQARLRAVAAEAATFRSTAPRADTFGARKLSMSTHDFVQEAMQIFNYIRSNRQARGEMSILPEVPEAEDHSSLVDDANVESISGSFSRPPSREGRSHAWRSQVIDEFQPSVLNHLKKFQETGDESFLVTSVVRSLAAKEKSTDMLHYQGANSDNQPSSTHYRRYSDSKLQSSNITTSRSYTDTYNTEQSNESTARTSSTRGTRTLPTISPDKVTHLIAAQEAQSGMRFDTQKQIWVRCRARRRLNTDLPSSSTGTEEDPFGQIPDLSVNELDEHQRQVLLNSQQEAEGHELSGVHITDMFYTDDAEGEADEGISQELEGESSVTNSQSLEQAQTVGEQQANGQDSHQHVHSESMSSNFQVGFEQSFPSSRLSELPQEAIKHKKREQSVMFSSPPVSHHHILQPWSDGTDLTTEEIPRTSHSDPGAYLFHSSAPEREEHLQSRRNQFIRQAQHFISNGDRTLSLSRIDEHHELSLISTRPDGRTLSLTVSVATPLPAHRQASRPALAVNANRSFMQTLSPLSEFTMHQDDSRHLQKRQLSHSNQPLRVLSGSAQSAVSTSRLVESLTTAEPDEVYWDWLTNLALTGQNLETLHGLDNFCPRIEELNASRNNLSHLEGAPSLLRELSVVGNSLTNLTDWSHLKHLQYLDLSSNDLDTLRGLSGLVHLREVIADDNRIRDLGGILEIDGLLSLSLRQNHLVEVDLRGCELKRLTTLRLDENGIQDVIGLECLPALKHLNLDQNRLIQFPCAEEKDAVCKTLEELSINSNDLVSMNILGLPSLTSLRLDGNHLTRITGTASHVSLQTLALRDQRPIEGARVTTLDEFPNISHLYISGTSLPPELPVSTALLNLQTLDVSCTGLQSLPRSLATLTPNLRSLDLSSNAVKDLRPIAGIARLSTVKVAHNRLSRIRRLAKVLKTLPSISSVDARGNPFCNGFYPHTFAARPLRPPAAAGELRNATVDADAEADAKHLGRLDEETAMRRRVYELLLAEKCAALQELDGLDFDRRRVRRKDAIWERLVSLGVIEAEDP